MSPDRAEDATAPCGFHSYADDTPRGPEPDATPPPVMAGWAETPEWRQVHPPPPAPIPWPKVAAAGGVAMGLIAAVALGRGALRDEPAARPAPAAAAATVEAPPLQVVVRDPPPPPAPARLAPADRLEVLPQTAAVAPRVPLAQATIPVSPAPPVVLAERLPPPPSAAAAVRDAVATAPPPAARRFNDCRDAPTRAYELVCRDMRLAAADRRMKRAYAAALAAGVPEGALMRDQDDWLEVREDAARVSPRAVADIYRQRTQELLAMARED